MKHYAGVKLEVIKTCRRCGYRSAWSIDWQRHAASCHSPRVVRVPQVRKGDTYPKPKRVPPSPELAYALIHFMTKGGKI